MGKKFDKFCLLMWKNSLLQWRHPIQTLIEIMAPVILASILVISRSLIEPVARPAQFYTPFENKIPVLRSLPTNQKLTFIAWSPYNPTLHKIMDEAITLISKDENHPFQLIPFNDSKTMDKYLSNDLNLKIVLCGVQFNDSLAGNMTLPSNINITFRFPGELRVAAVYRDAAYGQYVWKTNIIFPVCQVAGPRSWDMNTGAEPSYYFEGFLKLQQELSYSIIQHFKNTTENIRKAVPVLMQRYPYPKWRSDLLMVVLQTVVGLIVMLSFVYTCISTVKVITAEKEKQLKEAMKIKGFPNWLHWTAWFLKSLCLMLVTIALLVIMMKAKLNPGKDYTIFAASNPLVIYTFLIFYICATITFCFAISVFFSKANTAATMAGMIWFVTYFPYSFTQQAYDSITLPEKLLLSLFSNSAMAYGFQLIIMFEGIGEGVQWHNLWRTTTPDDDLKLGHLMLMLTIDTLLYFLIALYVETVFPGEYGVPEVWYFPFTKSFWCDSSRPARVEFQEQPKVNEFFEKEPIHLPVGVKIIHLRKEYPNNKVAVADLSLNMYQNQITVLLGHNGTGKTTTMSMLTGMITPSSGTAIVGGCNISTNMKGARESLGLCPQHNILFDDLTVKEHLYFYSRLKGLDDEDAYKEIEKHVKLLKLEPKTNALASTLSGGMQRKLSVGVALCGGSKVVVLDEPTAGMDPASRRALWNLLISQKKGRTMLLTTHFMDEADLLGDRIAIMSRGALQCCGSSFFLKKQYGIGYHLIIDTSENCDVKQVTALLNKHIPNIEVKSNVGSELTYLLSKEKLSVFEPMFGDLEKNSTALGILSYGVSLTTLEEVFMIVGADYGHEEALNPDKSRERLNKYLKEKIESRVNLIEDPNRPHNETNEVNVNTNNTLLTKRLLWVNQFKAMLMKRSLSILRYWFLFLIQCLIPVVFIILTIAALRHLKINKDLPKLKIQLDSYENPVTVLTHNENNTYAERYKEFLRKDKKLVIDWNNYNLTELILQETMTNISVVRLRYICGATFFENNSIKAWFNNEPFHSPPLTLQLVMNAILQQEVSSNHRIQIYNHPLPYPLQRKMTEMNRAYGVGFQLSFNLGFALTFVSSFYAIFYIQERACKSKHLQFVSGVGVIIFWGASFLCDVLTFIVICLCIIITLIGVQEPGFTTSEELSRIFSVLICFGFAVLPLMYLVSYLFTTPATGYTKITLTTLFTGNIGFLLVQILSAPELKLKHLIDILHWIFLIIPHYAVSTAIRDMYMMYSIHRACDEMIHKCVKSVSRGYLILTPEYCKEQICHMLEQCCTTTKNCYDLDAPGIGRNIIYLCSLSIFLITVLLFVEYHVFEKSQCCKKLPSSDMPSNITEDSDVKRENDKIRSASMEEIETYSLVMRDVTKYYGDFLAVNKICLAVNKFECFGLLGVNGAGKTTTFKMMTGDVKMSSGDAWVKGVNLNTKINKVYQLIGYCPQFDALLDDLTCRETLIIFSLLQGIHKKETKALAEKLAREFDFYPHLDKKVKQLSGGNKRKLSAAVSLTGDPLVLYLDEPTTGMDPATKRHLWNAICKARDRGTCIILTSHSMEECEALCTRMAIMVKGTFTCLGSTQHLKSKFSAGYTLVIKARKSEGDGEFESFDLQPIETYVKENFKTAIIREKHRELITFYITDKSQALSNMFGIMEKGKNKLNIEDYSLGQSSLEQVFLTFTQNAPSI